MFVQARRLRTQGIIAVTLATCSLLGCDDPIALTDLRPEGEPEVLTVLVMNDSEGLFLEQATFCALNDDKRPAFVGTIVGGFNVCDPDLTLGADPVADAVPTDLAQGGSGSGGWYVRIMFDELLDPNVEELLPVIDPTTMLETGQFTGSLANTQPVILTCNGVAVAYDGYYSPSGNNVTWPLGPSLFITPNDRTAIATGSDCTVEIKDSVVDKDGTPVPADQRGSSGQYGFSIAPLALAATDPEPSDPGDEPVIVPEAPVSFLFNAFVDFATLTADEVNITEHAMLDCSDAGTVVPDANVVIDGDDGLILISVNNGGSPDLAWKPETAYSITFTDTNAVADLAGGPGKLPGAADFTLCFNTDVAAP